MREFASFFDLSLLLKAFEKNGIAAKQLLSRANFASLIDYAHAAALGICLRKELCWSRIRINRAYVETSALATPNVERVELRWLWIYGSSTENVQV